MKTKILIALLVMTFPGIFLSAQNPFKSLSSAKHQAILTDQFFASHEISALKEKSDDRFSQGKPEPVSLSLDSGLSDANKLPKDTNYVAPERFKTKMPESWIIPGILIAYGLTTIGNHGLYSSRQARKDLLNFTNGKGGPVDDILIISPYVEFGALLLFKVDCRNDFVNTSLLVLKSQLLMLAIIYPMKYLTREERPYSYQLGEEGVPIEVRKENSSAFESMPSGHTAEAFLAATIVNKEFRYKSRWYGFGAYMLASTVGLYRMINDKHWESDVIVGAGIGILSANIVYATHKHRWGRNEVCVIPTFDGTTKGALFTYRF